MDKLLRELKQLKDISNNYRSTQFTCFQHYLTLDEQKKKESHDITTKITNDCSIKVTFSIQELST